MNGLLKMARSIVVVVSFACSHADIAAAADSVRVLWLKNPDFLDGPDPRRQLDSFLAMTRQFDQKIEVEAREVRGPSDLFLAVKVADADLIFGLTLTQVQFLANGGLLQPVGSRDIDTRISRFLYISPSNRRSGLPYDVAPDQIIAAPINVTLAVVCFDQTKGRASGIRKGDRPSLEEIAAGKGVDRIAFPDPRLDPVGRAVLLSAFASSNLHSGWGTVEMLDSKVDSYSRSNSQGCEEVESSTKSGEVYASFTTLDAAKQFAGRDSKWSFVLPREPIVVPNLFAVVGRDKPAPDGNLVRLYGRLTSALLERQIKEGSLAEFAPLLSDDLKSSGKGLFTYKSSGQIVDEWAARYDSKSRQNPFRDK